MDSFRQEFSELQTEVKAQEEQLKALRTKLEIKEHNRTHTENMERTESETRFKELHNLVVKTARDHVEHSEELALLYKRVDSTEESHEDLQRAIQKIHVSGGDR